MRFAHIAVVFGALLTAACATTGAHERHHETNWDENRDGYLDEAEFGACMDGNGTFGAWDADADGYVDEEEYRAGLSAFGVEFSPAAGYDGWDGDGDGRISRDDFLAAAYREVDVDGDGRIERLEFGVFGHAIGLSGVVGPAAVRTAGYRQE